MCLVIPWSLTSTWSHPDHTRYTLVTPLHIVTPLSYPCVVQRSSHAVPGIPILCTLSCTLISVCTAVVSCRDAAVLSQASPELAAVREARKANRDKTRALATQIARDLFAQVSPRSPAAAPFPLLLVTLCCGGGFHGSGYAVLCGACSGRAPSRVVYRAVLCQLHVQPSPHTTRMHMPGKGRRIGQVCLSLHMYMSLCV